MKITKAKLKQLIKEELDEMAGRRQYSEEFEDLAAHILSNLDKPMSQIQLAEERGDMSLFTAEELRGYIPAMQESIQLLEQMAGLYQVNEARIGGEFDNIPVKNPSHDVFDKVMQMYRFLVGTHNVDPERAKKMIRDQTEHALSQAGTHPMSKTQR